MFQRKRLMIATLLGLTAAAAGSVAMAAPAFAGNPLSCAAARTCGYADANYDNPIYSTSLSPYQMTGTANDSTSSVVNKRSNAVQLWDAGTCTGANNLTIAAGDVRADLSHNGFNDVASCLKNF